MKSTTFFLIVSLVVTLQASVASAQTSEMPLSSKSAPDTLSASPRYSLFRGRPLPYCKSFFVVEFGYLRELNRSRTARERLLPQYYTVDDPRWRLEWNFGYMVNSGPRSANGGTFIVAFDDDGNRGGFTARHRIWLGNPASQNRPMRVDLSAGPYLWATENEENRTRFPSFTSSLGINIEDYLAFVITMDLIRYRAGVITDFVWNGTGYDEVATPYAAYHNVDWYAGVKGGSYGAVAGTAGLAIVVAIAFASIDISD